MIKLHGGIELEESLATVGDRLGAVIRSSKLTHAEFGSVVGISRTTLHNYIKGERDIPLSVVQKVILEFELDSEWFLFGPDRRRG